MKKHLGKFYDSRRSDSVATSLRRKRFTLLRSLIDSTPKPLKIIDVGGTQKFWENMHFFAREVEGVEITLINLREAQVTYPNIKSIVGDARNMKQFGDNEFDVVVSNSVIEHVGDYNDQLQMASEVRRIGKRYFIQTPNLYFPIEPHFLFPFFQFLPLRVKGWLINHFNLGWYKKIPDKQKAIEFVASVRLLSRRECVDLFPNSNILEEKFLGLTKSFIMYGGWNTTTSLKV